MWGWIARRTKMVLNWMGNTFGENLSAGILIGVTAGAIAVVGAIGYAGYRGAKILWNKIRDNPRIERLQKKLKNKEVKIDELTKNSEKNKRDLEELELGLAAIRNNNVQLNARINRLENDINRQNNQLQALRLEKANLQRDLLEMRGGNGTKSAFNYAKYYYSSRDINNCLHISVIKQLGGFQLGCQFLLADTFNDDHNNPYRALLLPSLATVKANKNLSHNSELLQALKEGLDIKIIFPYLELNRQHWNTAEIQIQRNANSKYQVKCLMHDPRGGGEVPKDLSEDLKHCITLTFKMFNKDADVEFLTSLSPYQSCRQSKVDKLSCGPIVAKEIVLRIKDQSLDRRTPYGFGASELVQDQQHDLNDKLIEERSRFLSSLGR